MSLICKYWAPPLIWMALIFYFSTDALSSENTGSYLELILGSLGFRLSIETLNQIHFVIRKAAHFTEYAILSLLLYRAFRGGRGSIWRAGWALSTALVLAVYALLDEFHQTFTATRSGSIYDSAIDFAGGLTALLLIRLYSLNKKG